MNRRVEYAIYAFVAAVAGAAIMSHAFAADVRSVDSSFGKMEIVESGETVSWSGLYVGGSVGYGNANHETDLRVYGEDDGQSVDQSLGVLNGLNSSGVIGGIRAGYDAAFGKVLIGVFGEYQFSGMETELTIQTGGAPLQFGLEKQDEWTIGGRAGIIVAPRTLAYILAGYTHTEYEVTGVPANAGLTTGAEFDGLTVGGGIEFALAANVFFGLEYQHTFYGEETLINQRFCEDGSCGIRVDDTLDEDKVLGTLKIKFGGLAR